MKRYKAYVKDGKVVLKGAPAPDGRAAGGSSKTFARQMKGFFTSSNKTVKRQVVG